MGGGGGASDETGAGGTIEIGFDVGGIVGIGGGLTVVGLGNPLDGRPEFAPIGTPVGPVVKEPGEACPNELGWPKLELLEAPCGRPGLPPRGVTPEPVEDEADAGVNGLLVPVVEELLRPCEDGGTLVRAVAL